jgi:hypothetical protein
MGDARNKILENILAFCNKDEKKAKDLFFLIQKTIEEDYTALKSLHPKNDRAAIVKMMNRMLFSLSILKEKQALDSANIIDEKLHANNDIAENLYTLFISELAHLNTLLHKEPNADTQRKKKVVN